MATLPKAFWPVTISASNGKIDFNRGGVKVATIAAGTYYSAAELATAVDAALTAADGATTWTVDFPTTGKVRVSASAAFVLLFSTGANAAASARHILGFGVVDTASSTSAVATYQHQNGWYGDRSVGFDGKAWFRRLGGQTVALSGRPKAVTWSELEYRSVTFSNLPAWKAKVEREGSNLNEALERLWRDGFARFRWWPDASVEGTYTDYALEERDLKEFNPARLASKELYTQAWTFRRYV